MKFEWKCPKCGAPAHGHGKGGLDKCDYEDPAGLCEGFICECMIDDNDECHGMTLENPCPEANCYHCGWGGTFPVPPKGLQAWEKKALAAGWTMPDSRAKELEGK